MELPGNCFQSRRSVVNVFGRFPEVLGSLMQVVSSTQKYFLCSLTYSGLANPIFS